MGSMAQYKVVVELSDAVEFDIKAVSPRHAAQKAMREVDEYLELEGEAQVVGVKVYYDDAGNVWYDPKELSA
ncbi:hypothetical protein LCGC14_2757480 [marine sediment metagenome]|uniref:Uncharacterized protein n=1 Tax=marine sediment metagenome TaxID=412755 RepID=A0A0F9BRM1_9ZZZZ